MASASSRPGEISISRDLGAEISLPGTPEVSVASILARLGRYTKLEIVQQSVHACTADQQESLKQKMPAAMLERGWVVSPWGDFVKGHRMVYNYSGPEMHTGELPFFFRKDDAILWWEQRLLDNMPLARAPTGP